MAGYLSVAVKLSHLPIGQRSVAILNLAHVEHPHIRQRPVPFSTAASHSRHVRQVYSRVAMISGGVGVNPDFAKRATAAPAVAHCFKKFRPSDSLANLIPNTIL
jgi:hypothetical protein